MLGQQPVLNIASNFQVALHHYAIGNFQNQHNQQQKPAVEAEVEFHYFHLAGFPMKAETASRKNQENNSDQQQHPARGRQFFKNRPCELLQSAHPPVPPCMGQLAGFHIAGVEPITTLRVALELRPQLIDLQAFGHSLPEPLQAGDHPFSAVSNFRRNRAPGAWIFSWPGRLEGHARWRL